MWKNSVDIVETLTEAQIRDLHRLYQNEWWTAGRSLPDVQRMVRHSDFVFAAVDRASGALVGFARVLTDQVYKALIFDVIIARDHRGAGLGKALMVTILSHPELKQVQHVELYGLPEMIPFYEQWGFTDQLGPLRFMRRDTSSP